MENKPSILSKFQNILFFVTGIISPIFFIPKSLFLSSFSVNFLFIISVIVLFILTLINILMSGRFEIIKSKYLFIVCFVFIPLIYVLSGINNGFNKIDFFGYNFDISTMAFLLVSFIFLFELVIYSKEKNTISYYIGLFISFILVTLFVILRIIFGAEFISMGVFNNIISTPFGNWNNTGEFFGVITLLSSLSLSLFDFKKIMRIIISTILLISLFLLVLVGFNVIWYTLALSSFLFIFVKTFYVYKNEGRLSFSVFKKIPKAVGLVLIISLFFSTYGVILSEKISSKLGTVNTEVRPSLGVTLDIAKNTINNHPVLGSGSGTFVNQWLSYKPDSIVGTDFWNIDFYYGIGLIPTFIVTTGFAGFISWIMFFIVYIYIGIKFITKKEKDILVEYFGLSSLFISLYLWILTWVYVPNASILILTFLFTGIFFGNFFSSNNQIINVNLYSNLKNKIISYIILSLVIITMAIFGYSVLNNIRAMNYFEKGSVALNSNDPVSAENYINKAINIIPYDAYYRALTQIESFKIEKVISQSKNMSQEELQKAFNEAVSSTLNSAIKAKDSDPSNYLNWVYLGNVYGLLVPYKISGAYENAQASFSEALRINPKNPSIILLMSKLAASNNDLNSAVNYALQAINYKKNYIDAYYLLAQIEVSGNNLPNAIEAMKSVVTINPNDPSGFYQLGVLQYSNKDLSSAIGSFEKALSLYPQYANAQYFLGLSYQSLGQHDKAIYQFEQLLKTNPDNQEVQLILSNLKAGKNIFKTSNQPKTAQTKTNQ